MQFSTLAQYFDRLEKTPARLKITEILADLFKKASPQEIRQICYLSLGALGPQYKSIEFKIAGKLILKVIARAYNSSLETATKTYAETGDIGETVIKLSDSKKTISKISVSEVFDRLLKIAQAGGKGSVETKTVLMTQLLLELDPLSAKYLVRVTLGNMRLGFSEKTLVEALSWMEKGDKSLKKEIESSYNVYPDIGEVAARFKESGLKGLKDIQLTIGVPVLPELCQRVNTPEEMLERMGGKVAAEPKFDGERIQLHFDRSRKNNNDVLLQLNLEPASKKSNFFIKMFTRNLEEVSSMFPELAEAANEQINADSVIFDGEVVGIDPKTQKFIPFQETIQRKRKYGISEKSAQIPIHYYVFDILYRDGESLLKMPFSERRGEFKKAIKSGDCIYATPQKVLTDPLALKEFLAEEVARGVEGLVVKDLRSSYEAGGRGYTWIKYKPVKDTIDAVVLGYYFGKGKRADFGTGSFLVGVYDENSDTFKSLTKIGTGATDEEWREIRKRSDELGVSEKPSNVDVPKELFPTVWVKPSLVVVIQYDEITRSPLHAAGFALRFPRLIQFRDDKLPEQATTVSEISEMYRS